MPILEADSYTIFTLAERPELREYTREFALFWQAFMRQDPVSGEYWYTLHDYFPALQTAMVDESGMVIARGHSVPLVWDGTIEGLPESWDAAFIHAAEGYQAGHQPNTLSAVEITIDPNQRGKGISQLMVQGMRKLAQVNGLSNLIAPVRPSLKAAYPLTPMERYITWTDAEGAPFDPWLRVHWRAGAKILKVAPRSMVIPGTVAEWEQWAGMRFPESGQYIVPGALEPVTIDREKDQGLYIEPNVWMQHTVS